MVTFKVWILAAFLLQSVSIPLRIGDVAQKLTASEVTDLEKIAAAGGAKGTTWLIESPVPQLGNRAIRLYLPAETQTPELRRGPVMELIRQQGQSTWSPQVVRPVQYAQLLKTGKDVNSISGEQRPFIVTGRFSDEEVLAIVRLVRRSEGSARILGLDSKSDTSATVGLAADRDRVRLVSLIRQGTTWKVSGVVTGIP